MKGCVALNEKQIEVVLSNLLQNRTHGLRDATMFILGLRTGFRISELLSIKVCDVAGSENGSGYVEVAKANTKGKVSGRRVVLSPETMNYVVRLIGDECLESGDYLFKSQKGNKPINRGQAHHILKNAYESISASGRVATHSMRKTFANKVHKALGSDITKTQKALGHKNINSTVSYLNINQDEINMAILAL